MINKLPAYNLSSSSTPNCRAFLKNLRQIVKCGICGHKQRIEFHHIKPTSLNGHSRGMNRRALDIMKHPMAYIPLCYFCHQKVTQGVINISDTYVPILGEIRLGIWTINGVDGIIHVI